MSNVTYRIVVGVDFTETGDNALDEAIYQAARMGDDELHAVFVIARDGKRDLASMSDALISARDRLRQRVIARCEEVGIDGEQKVVFHVRIGDPAEQIHQVAIDVDADLVVVGTHGRRGLEKVLLGSVAEALVRTARVPVLVARPNELADLPRSATPEPADPRADLHARRAMSSELLSFGKRDSHIAGLV